MGYLFYPFVHFIDYFLVHFALLGHHVQFDFEIFDLAAFLFYCPPQINKIVRRHAWIFLAAPHIVVVSSELVQLLSELLVLFPQRRVLFSNVLHLVLQLFELVGWAWDIIVAGDLLRILGLGFLEREDAERGLVGSHAQGKWEVFGRLDVGHVIFGAFGPLQVVDRLI